MDVVFPDKLPLKDLIQISAWSVASVGGVIAAFRAVAEMRRGRTVAARDLRFTKAEQGKKLVDELLSDKAASDALKMIDWSGLDFEIDKDRVETVTGDDVATALRPDYGPFTNKERFIRDCFDALFERCERFEHFVRIGLTDFEDISRPIDYYVNRMSRVDRVYNAYFDEFGYSLMPEFLNRFNAWKERAKTPPPTAPDAERKA